MKFFHSSRPSWVETAILPGLLATRVSPPLWTWQHNTRTTDCKALECSRCHTSARLKADAVGPPAQVRASYLLDRTHATLISQGLYKTSDSAQIRRFQLQHTLNTAQKSTQTFEPVNIRAEAQRRVNRTPTHPAGLNYKGLTHVRKSKPMKTAILSPVTRRGGVFSRLTS